MDQGGNCSKLNMISGRLPKANQYMITRRRITVSDSEGQLCGKAHNFFLGL